MEKDQIARLSLIAALGAATLGILIVIVFSVLLATLPGPNTADGSNFASIYGWQERLQQYTALREMGQAFIFAAIPFAILAVGLHQAAARSEPPPPLARVATVAQPSEPGPTSSRRKTM